WTSHRSPPSIGGGANESRTSRRKRQRGRRAGQARGIVNQLASKPSSGGCRLKALVKSQSRPGLWLEDVPEPSIGINDVLLRVHLTGICGTDLHIYQWDEWAARTIPVPMVVGHEFVGEIVAVGSNVNDF